MSAAGWQASLYGSEAFCNNIRWTNTAGAREAYSLQNAPGEQAEGPLSLSLSLALGQQAGSVLLPRAAPPPPIPLH